MPLHGKSFLNTRPRDQLASLSSLLEESGGSVFELPLLEIVPRTEQSLLPFLEAGIRKGDWLVVTSANGASIVLPFLSERQFRLAALGPQTAQSFSAQGVEVDFVGSGTNSREFGESFITYLKGLPFGEAGRVILFRGNKASEELPKFLRANRIAVREIIGYDTVLPSMTEDTIKWLVSFIFGKKLDMLIFTSSEAVNSFGLVGARQSLYPVQEWRSAVCKVPVAVIGERTADTARSLELNVVAVAGTATVTSLVEAIEEYYANQQ